MKLGSVLAASAGLAAISMSQPIPALHVQGTRMVDSKGVPVTLRGCNLGNWLMIELWMLGIEGDCGANDQQDLFNILDSRFGRPQRDRLMDIYRSNWIQDRDFEVIHSYRMNLVRLPMDYRLFEDDAKPKVLRKDAFKWIDRCVQMAAKHGIYVVLDMHGIQGGQSTYEHTGESGKNKFWTSAEDQDRASWLWEKIAERYRKNNAVIAYDLMNEPYGGTHEQQIKGFSLLYKAVRNADPEKLVFIHGHYDGFDHYGDPKVNGWHNVGFQMHYYPGLFGNGRPTLGTHVRHFASMPAVAEKVKKLNVPFIVGEMNPVFAKLGVDMTRRTFDLYESYGWMTTIWSYKLATREGGFYGGSWGLVANHNPMPRVNFKTDSLAKIEGWMKNLGDMKWDVYTELQKTMAPVDPKLPALALTPESLKPRTELPKEQTLPGWQVADIGGAKPGSLTLGSNGEINLFGSGDDVWNSHDAARFLYQRVTGDFDLTATVDGMDEVETYAKAGLWVRPDLTADAPHLLLTTFSDGGLQFVGRVSKGGETSEVGSGESSLPGLSLKLQRRGGHFAAYFRSGESGDWTLIKDTVRDDLPPTLLVGLLSLSHDSNSFNLVRYHGLSLK